MLISYQRAKAESLGYDAKGGLMERAERFIVLGFGLFFSECSSACCGSCSRSPRSPPGNGSSRCGAKPAANASCRSPSASCVRKRRREQRAAAPPYHPYASDTA